MCLNRRNVTGLGNKIALSYLVTLALVLSSGCSGGQSFDGGGASGGNGGGGGSGGSGGHKAPDPAIDASFSVANSVPATVVANAHSPAAPGGGSLPWPEAELMSDVEVLANHDSVWVVVPVVPGAFDYRVFALTDDTTVANNDGVEAVGNTTIYCAGYRQRNNEEPMQPELLRVIEVAGITAETRLVVEAVDTVCPFTGVRGLTHADVPVYNGGLEPDELADFSVYTEAEIVATYGALIENGHRSGSALGGPAAPIDPVVIARTTITVEPGQLDEPADFFDGFEVDGSPTYIGEPEVHSRTFKSAQYQNDNWNFYAYGIEHHQFFNDRGRYHSVLADWAQEIFGQNYIVRRQTVDLYDDSYLHVTYEVPSNATQRRYWWFFLCGDEELGQTLDETGALASSLIQLPFFYQEDGRKFSLDDWNCLQIFARDGLPAPLAPTNTRSESDMRVMVNLPNAEERDGVVNVSPDQYNAPGAAFPSWYRRQDAEGNLMEPVLDDQMLINPRTKYNLFIRRDRVVMYINGEQALCNDFPDVPLTMSEAAVGLGHVLYHSAAERHEFSRGFNLRTGQVYYLNNAPYVDVRTFDNIGYEQNVNAPTNFDDSLCHTHVGGR